MTAWPTCGPGLATDTNARPGADLTEAHLEGRTLTGADLSGVDLRHTNLTGACVCLWTANLEARPT